MTQNNSNNAFNISFLFSILLAICVGLFILWMGKFDSFQFINSHHSTFFDYFFRFYTYLGDGFLWIPFFLYCIFLKKDFATTVIAGFIISSLLTQLLKRVVFPDELRPVTFLTTEFPIHLIEGIKMNRLYSFPSGHTATAFTIALLITILINKRIWNYLLPLLALLVGYSRLYLAQHFVSDVLFGIVIGIVSAFLSYYLIKKSHPKRDF